MALENQLEAEQEYITHRLQKQVAQLAGEKAGLQRERSELQRQVRRLVAGLVTESQALHVPLAPSPRPSFPSSRHSLHHSPSGTKTN